jgi:hypothetical protein
LNKTIFTLPEQFTVMSNTENKENITLIGFDPNIRTRDYSEQMKKELRESTVVVFQTALDPYVTCIQSIDKKDTLNHIRVGWI